MYPECSGGCQDPMWDIEGLWQGVGRGFWAAGMGCVALGKMRSWVPRPEWKTYLLIQ